MSSADLEHRIAEMHRRLASPEIAEAPNRRGHRAATGGLLEKAYVDLVRRLSPDLSVEIGAHEAGYSLRLRSLCPDMQIIAFEANPFVYERFASGPDPEVQGIDYRNRAICAETGPVQLYVPKKWNWGTFVRANRISSVLQRTGGDFEYETIEVPGQALDDALSGRTYSSAVAWIDAEGAQHVILTGAAQFLARASAIYIELETAEFWSGQHSASEVSNHLQSLGFRSVMQDRLARAQFNAVFVRDEDAVLAETAPVLDAYLDALGTLIEETSG